MTRFVMYLSERAQSSLSVSIRIIYLIDLVAVTGNRGRNATSRIFLFLLLTTANIGGGRYKKIPHTDKHYLARFKFKFGIRSGERRRNRKCHILRPTLTRRPAERTRTYFKFSKKQNTRPYIIRTYSVVRCRERSLLRDNFKRKYKLITQ